MAENPAFSHPLIALSLTFSFAVQQKTDNATFKDSFTASSGKNQTIPVEADADETSGMQSLRALRKNTERGGLEERRRLWGGPKC